MNKKSPYIIVGILAIIGIVAFGSWKSKQKLKTSETTQIRTENLKVEKKQANRKLRLVVAYDFGQDLKTITEKATPKLIKNTMESIDWNEFHIVQLEDENDNALHVSGSLGDDGLASGFVTKDNHILMEKPIETIDQMTEILLDFLKGEEIWRKKYQYK